MVAGAELAPLRVQNYCVLLRVGVPMADRKDETKSNAPTRRDQLIRTVATSTALETGESSRKIEERLRSRKGRFKDLTLA